LLLGKGDREKSGSLDTVKISLEFWAGFCGHTYTPAHTRTPRGTTISQECRWVRGSQGRRRWKGRGRFGLIKLGASNSQK